MSNQRMSNTVPLPMMILSDVFGFFLSLLPGTLTWAIGIFLMVQTAFKGLAFYFMVILFPWILTLIFCLVLFLTRIVLPKLKPGLFKVSMNKGFVTWTLHFYLNRAITLSGLLKFIRANNVFKFLYMRALGGKVSFQTTMSLNVEMTDVPLITIGKGSTITEAVKIYCHTFTGSLLVVNPVVIGENVFVGAETVVGPGTQIGSKSWIGARNILVQNVFPEQSILKNFEWTTGKPES